MILLLGAAYDYFRLFAGNYAESQKVVSKVDTTFVKFRYHLDY